MTPLSYQWGSSPQLTRSARWHSFWSLPVWAIAIWVSLVGGILGRVAFSSPYSQSVVPIYMNAGERWLNHDPIYAPSPPLDLYRNLPPLAAFFAPLSLLPPIVAALLWRLISISLFLLAVMEFEALWPPLSQFYRGLYYAIAAELVLPSFNNGQVNVLLIATVMLGATETAKARYWMAGFWLSIACWLKGYPIGAGMLLCLTAPALWIRMLMGVVVVFLISCIGQTHDYIVQQFRDFLELAALDDRTYAPLHRIPRDWRIVPRIWFDLVISSQVAQLVSIFTGGLFAMAVIVPVWLKERIESIRLAVSLGVIWMTLFGPATENVTYTLFAATSAMAVAQAGASFRAILPWIAYLLLLAPIIRGIFPSDDVLPCRTVQPIAAVLLLVQVLYETYSAILSRRRTSAELQST